MARTIKVKSETPVAEQPASNEKPVVEKKTKQPKAPKEPVVVEATATETESAEKPVEKTEKQTKKRNKKEPVVSESVESAINAVEKSVDEITVPEVGEEQGISSDASVTYGKFLDKLQQVSTLIAGLKAEFRAIEKMQSRELKTALKQSSKRKQKSGNRAPSGFVKPTKISNELALFLGKDIGTEMARTAVTKEINAYITMNNLKNPANGREIKPDDKLAKLLKLSPDSELTYFNLQRYMSPHFAKKGDLVAPSTEIAV